MRLVKRGLWVPLCFLLMTPSVFGQASTTKNVTVDLNAFANGLVLPDGSQAQVTLNAMKIPPSATLSAQVFNFSTFTFAFSSESLATTEFHFADTNSASVNHTFTTGGLAGENFDLMWAGTGSSFHTTSVQEQESNNGVFHFSQTSNQKAATVTGTINGAAATGGFATISDTASQQVTIIHP